jgi:hypothetical protein
MARNPTPPTTQPTTRGQLNLLFDFVGVTIGSGGAVVGAWVGGTTTGLSLNELAPNWMIALAPLDLPIRYTNSESSIGSNVKVYGPAVY